MKITQIKTVDLVPLPVQLGYRIPIQEPSVLDKVGYRNPQFQTRQDTGTLSSRQGRIQEPSVLDKVGYRNPQFQTRQNTGTLSSRQGRIQEHSVLDKVGYSNPQFQTRQDTGTLSSRQGRIQEPSDSTETFEDLFKCHMFPMTVWVSKDSIWILIQMYLLLVTQLGYFLCDLDDRSCEIFQFIKLYF